ncbi:twin-arginine translocase subunit TatC [Aeromonas salmonicida]|uniref:Sec-independent protein translocase protein TatC n=4 Tax=Bacteria TaxID=2 RepID=T0PNM7_AERSA|nr:MULTISPECIES: twin-arginine translocase subunit TatC [Aeromonas]ELI6434378.1 twin-arginine translocase subunit TatC [Aeromonas salmonicida subsp. salmonicida]MBP8080320.1 twin-arginine translocase subunit TatC [Aeromonas sp.]ATP11531.1 twin arginine translocation system protein TatC [Aeromonas salmonicida subsp. pectinolytica 34mel]ATU99817.1 twin-arginine translocase subunit TatC [Aeromonas salmonicida]EQC04391.1 twin arginine translocation protein C [Aeromonas salmonicida subsp. pectinoly
MSQAEQPLISHLIELRTRLLHAISAILLVFVCLVYFSNNIYDFVAQPLLSQLPAGTSMIATDVATPFLTPIKLTIVVSFFLAIPYLLYQAWAFIAPGLYKHERRLIMPLVFSSAALFYAGMAFAYYVVFPLVFGFFTSTAPAGVTIATDIASYLDFVLTLFFAFGVAFEIPVATILLCWTGVTNPQSLREKRPYVIVGVFVVGMLLTPPDVFSQTLLAIPMWALWEIGLFFARFYVKKEDEEQQEQTEEGS